MAPKLVIRRPSYFGVAPTSHPAAAADTVEVAFSDVKRWILNGAVVRHLFRYSEVELLSHRVAYISKPFLAAVLVRALSHGRCFFSDDSGERIEIDFGALMRYSLLFLWDLVRIPALLTSVAWKARRLEWEATNRDRAPSPDLELPPLYLRSDLLFGLRSGGSVGHIAGVLNHLDRFTGSPIFFTSDRIPTVRPDIETHVIMPSTDFCGFEEIPGLYFNRLFIARALSLLERRPISFVYQRYTLNGYSGLEVSRRLGVPFVLEFNGSEVWINRNWGRSLTYESIARRIETLLVKAADLVVVVSGPIRDQLLEWGVSGHHILVNPNGVDEDRYSPDVDGGPVRRRHGLEGKRVVGFIGTFGRWHGAEVLADAFGRLMGRYPKWRKTVRLLMIGDGLTMPQVRANLDRHGVGDLAVLVGRVPQEEGPGHLAACDLFVSPHVPNSDGTPFFGSPTKVFEYMAMGKGIIASDLDQIGKVLRHGKTAWMVEPGAVDPLVSAMEHLLLNETLALRLGEAARRDVVAQYTWKEHTRRIVERLAVSGVAP